MVKKIKLRSNVNSSGESLYQCPFPNCRAIFAKELNQPETCLKHRALIYDVQFILDHIKQGPPEDKPTEEDKPVLLIPKPGMGDQAIQAVLKEKGGM